MFNSLYVMSSRQNIDVAMLLFTAGMLLIIFGRYVWKNQKADKVPGYRKLPNEDTAAYSKYLGQAHMYGGGSLLFLSLPLNEEMPNGYFAMICLGICIILLVVAFLTLLRASRERRK